MTMMMITRSVNSSQTDLCLLDGQSARVLVPIPIWRHVWATWNEMGLLLSDRKLPVVERLLSLAFWAL